MAWGTGTVFVCKWFAVSENGDILKIYDGGFSDGSIDYRRDIKSGFKVENTYVVYDDYFAESFLKNLRFYNSGEETDGNSKALFEYLSGCNIEPPSVKELICEIIGYTNDKEDITLYGNLKKTLFWEGLWEGRNPKSVSVNHGVSEAFAKEFIDKAILHPTNSFRFRFRYYPYLLKKEVDYSFDDGDDVLKFKFTEPTLKGAKTSHKKKDDGQKKTEYKKSISANYKAKVKFEDGKSYFYNSRFYVEIGNKVKVSGSRSSMIGEITEVSAAPSKASYMQDITEVLK